MVRLQTGQDRGAGSIARWWAMVPLLLAFALCAHPRAAQALEVIQIRTGQVAGLPGACPQPDDTWRYNATGMTLCPQPFRTAPFVAADFAGAAAGPPARVINPLGPWLPALPVDPQARWINWAPTGNCIGAPSSVLYAYRFNVTTECEPKGTIEVCWAADDQLGDPAGGPNPVGIYINGVPLTPAGMGGNYAGQTCFSASGIPLNTGANYLYVYQRDLGCSASGFILSATMTVQPGLCSNLLVTKFNDANGNGVQDGGENGLPGWTINVAGPTPGSGVTNASGQALFACLDPGVYTVTETPQAGWVQTAPPGGVHTITIGCGLNYVLEFGNRRCVDDPCIKPPKCLTSWYQFDEMTGTIANEVAANRDGMILSGGGGPSWLPGGSPGNNAALGFPGGTGTQSVVVPDAPEHDFGTGSFTLFSWVKPAVIDNNIRTLVDKRVTPFGTPTGYALYIYGGVLRLQLGDGSGPFSTWMSTAPPMAVNTWHTVAAIVCRNPANPASNRVTLIVDNHVDTFTTAIPTGNLSNNANMVIGDQCPGFIVGIPFAGAIDELQHYRCCLSVQQVLALRSDLGFCRTSCYVPSIRNTPFGSVSSFVKICNYSVNPQTYTWTAAPLPAGLGCSVNGPTVYSPFSGTVTIPGASSGPSCVVVPFTITLPAGMTPGQTACYEVMVQNVATQECCVARGRVRKTLLWHVLGDPVALNLPPGGLEMARFTAYNAGLLNANLECRLRVVSVEDGEASAFVSLNGLPPGEPVFRTLSAPPDGTDEAMVEVQMLAFQPFDPQELLIEADLDGDGEYEPLECITIVSEPEGAASSVPEANPGTFPSATLVDALSVHPNPFVGRTGIVLTIGAAQERIRVEVFDVGGRLVRSLFDGRMEKGDHGLTWDGLDEAGRRTANGLYFIRATSPEIALQRKMIRIE